MFDYRIYIADQRIPLVVLFGPRASGKMMTLIRLREYLRKRGMHMTVDQSLRPSGDKSYEILCKWFEQQNVFHGVIDDLHLLDRTILVRILDQRARPICQILRLEGDLCFDTDLPNYSFQALYEYIQSITNKKIWLFFVEENWGGSQTVRDLYAKKIQEMHSRILPMDKSIFIFNKVDRSNHFRPDGRPNAPGIFQNIKNQYPLVFDRYVNRNPITRWFAPYKFDFVTFSAGTFDRTVDGRHVYAPGEDFYPEQLWKVIKKNV